MKQQPLNPGTIDTSRGFSQNNSLFLTGPLITPHSRRVVHQVNQKIRQEFSYRGPVRSRRSKEFFSQSTTSRQLDRHSPSRTKAFVEAEKPKASKATYFSQINEKHHVCKGRQSLNQPFCLQYCQKLPRRILQETVEIIKVKDTLDEARKKERQTKLRDVASDNSDEIDLHTNESLQAVPSQPQSGRRGPLTVASPHFQSSSGHKLKSTFTPADATLSGNSYDASTVYLSNQNCSRQILES